MEMEEFYYFHKNMTDANLVKEELIKRELATRKLKYFIPYVFPAYKMKDYHELVCDAVDLLINKVITRLIINLPPQYGKSEIVSRKTPPYFLGRFPSLRILLISYAASLAKDLSSDARDIIANELYSNLFGVNSLIEDTVELNPDNKSVISWRIANHNGGLTASGIGGGISGHRADFIIIDDPVKDDEDAQSESISEKQENWFWSSAYTRLWPDAPILLCQTRWNERDLTGRLLAKQKETGEWWYILRIPAIAETPTQIKQWCEMNSVFPEFLLTREMVNLLPKLEPRDRPHARITEYLNRPIE